MPVHCRIKESLRVGTVNRKTHSQSDANSMPHMRQQITNTYHPQAIHKMYLTGNFWKIPLCIFIIIRQSSDSLKNSSTLLKHKLEQVKRGPFVPTQCKSVLGVEFCLAQLQVLLQQLHILRNLLIHRRQVRYGKKVTRISAAIEVELFVSSSSSF